jgi:hypothetical protein
MHKVCIAFSKCRRAVRNTWGLTPKVVTWLYTYVVRPILSYASLVWWKRVELKMLRNDSLWYACNTNVCFGGYVNVATLTFVHKTRLIDC